MSERDESAHLELEILEQTLKTPFRIATQTITEWSTVIYRLYWNGHVGLGESAPFARYGDSTDAIEAYFASTPLELSRGPFALRSTIATIPRAARCGIDLALHDLLGKSVAHPLRKLLGLDGMAVPATSLSIPVDQIDVMVRRVRELRDAPIVKIKVGAGSDIETVAALRENYTGTIRIDANEGWSPEEAVSILRELERFDIEFCEQPIASGAPEQLKWIRERTSIPIVADEDSVTAADLPALSGCVDGVNVKLSKCGGIIAALDMIAVARTFGFRVMIGCMIETEILAAAAAQLAPLADWLDIDGPLLVTGRPFAGVDYRGVSPQIQSAPGLGVRALADIDQFPS